MKVYKVTQKYYDNGKVDYTVETVFMKKEDIHNITIEKKFYDLYIDYFTSRADLDRFLEGF